MFKYVKKSTIEFEKHKVIRNVRCPTKKVSLANDHSPSLSVFLYAIKAIIVRQVLSIIVQDPETGWSPI